MSIERDENFVPRTRTDYNLPPESNAHISDYHEVFEETPIYSLARVLFMQALGWQYYLLTNAMGSPMYPPGTNVSLFFLNIHIIYRFIVALPTIFAPLQAPRKERNYRVQYWSRSYVIYSLSLDEASWSWDWLLRQTVFRPLLGTLIPQIYFQKRRSWRYLCSYRTTGSSCWLISITPIPLLHTTVTSNGLSSEVPSRLLIGPFLDGLDASSSTMCLMTTLLTTCSPRFPSVREMPGLFPDLLTFWF